jgi:hypothetical protein
MVGQSIFSNNEGMYVKQTHQKSSATFLPFFLKSPKNSAAEIFMGPLLCFAAEISASWQHWKQAMRQEASNKEYKFCIPRGAHATQQNYNRLFKRKLKNRAHQET